jgi:hypothetical protein
MVPALLAAHCVFQSADRVLHLAGGLIGLALSFQLLIAEGLPCSFFHRAFSLLCRTNNSILVHRGILRIYLLGVQVNGLVDVLFQRAW